MSQKSLRRKLRQELAFLEKARRDCRITFRIQVSAIALYLFLVFPFYGWLMYRERKAYLADQQAEGQADQAKASYEAATDYLKKHGYVVIIYPSAELQAASERKGVSP